MAEEGHIPPRDHGRKKASTPMEFGTPSEILPVEVAFNFPHVYLLDFDYFEALASSLLIIFGFLNNYFFSAFLGSRRGRYFLLQL